VIEETESAALRTYVQGRSLVSSRVAVVEVGKAVARANPAADPQPMLSRIAFIELDADLARVAGAAGKPDLRSLDAIHLASALRLGADVDAMVTYDDRQASVARDLGLPVAAPGRASE
jgi:uncharacterized protein